MPKFSIVIPTYTNSVGLHACLASIVKHTDLQEVSILVVANGAPPESCDVDKQYPNTQLIWLPEACGYTKATNIGIKVAMAEGAEFIVLMNDDFLLTDNQKGLWLHMLLSPFLQDGAVGITGPVRNFCYAANRSFLIFFCVMVRTAMLREIGILDEIFSPGSGEDTDLCCRAEDRGWKVCQIPSEEPTQLVDKGCDDLPDWKKLKMHTSGFPGYHDGNATFSLIPEIYEPAMQKNHAILKAKYNPEGQALTNQCPRCNGPAENSICIGGERGNCDGLILWRAHAIDGWFNIDEGAWLAQQVKSLPPHSLVLEVGSWHGRSSRFIADNLSEGSKVVCVDSWNGSSGEPDAHLSAAQREGDHAHSWWWCNANSHILAGRVIPMREHSANAAETLGHLIAKGEMEKFSLAFIDGDHSEEGIKTDVEAWLPLLKDDGLLCGHDYYKENEGPWWVHVRQYVEQKFPNVQKSATSIWHVRPHAEVVEPERGHVYDCFLFHNELDVLEIRLATLYDHVDRFVLVEANQTHAGLPKPLYFDENRERFAKYLDKIDHVVCDLPTIEGSIYDQAWHRERYQRNMCMAALEKSAQPNDVIIIGDADEIASPEAIANYKLSDGIVRLKQRMFYYYLNCENKEGWDWQKIAPYSEVKRLTPCGIRYPPAGDLPLVEAGGWHFSFCGNAEHVSQKLSDYSHREYDTPEINNVEVIRQKVEAGEDVFGRDLKYEFVEIDDSYPQYVLDHRDDLVYKGLIKPQTEQVLPVVKSGLGWKKHWTVTAEVSTKDRYQTTLPLTLSAIINQTRKPDKLKVYDDGEQVNLFELSPFNGLLRVAQDKGIDVEVLSTPRKGQVSNHQHCLDNADTDFIYRCDDDEIPEPNCLETLLDTIRDHGRGDQIDRIGAVGGLVHHPANVSPLSETLTGKLSDIDRGNIQWASWNHGTREVEHLYSTFIFRVDAAREAGGYSRDLSPVGHREESIFSHSIHRAGYKLLVTPHTKTHHLRESSGGIRSFNDTALWEHDERVFQRYLQAWNIPITDTKLIVCDFGLGDHLILKGIWGELKRRFPDRKWTLALCFPEVFKNEHDITIISIADAKLLLGNRYDEHSVYRYAWNGNFVRPMNEVMMEFFSK